jgi:beta-phosphoglucomutase-like phosphatase (HAD superfamily)
MIKVIIFDLGGIIFKVDWIRLNKEFFDKFGISTLIRTQYGKKIQKIYDDTLIGKKKMKDVFKEICKQENKKHNIKELCNFYKEAYKRNKILNQELIGLIKNLEKVLKLFVTLTLMIYILKPIKSKVFWICLMKNLLHTK